MNKKTSQLIIIYLILSCCVILFSKYIHLGIVYIDLFYTWINYQIAHYILWLHSPIIRKILVLVLMPIIIIGIPALIYRLIYKKNMPNFYESIWILWLIIVLSNYLIK